MDKKDVLYGVAAIAIILIMAVVAKPMMTGQPVKIGFSTPTTPVQNMTVTVTPAATPILPVITLQPTPVPATTWNRSVQSVGFVNSSVYGILPGDQLPNSSRFDYGTQNNTMVSFAKINGQYSGTTQVVTIPFPYWELVYTVDPVEESKPASVKLTPTRGEAVAISGIQGSYSGVIPSFTIQVMDAGDPNRIVRTISPPGGIDINLWKGVKNPVNPAITPKQNRVTNDPGIPVVDPRPWTEKFYEGKRGYYFIITSQLLKSYSIDIRVRASDVGNY